MSMVGLTEKDIDMIKKIKCVWREDEYGLWWTDCHEIHEFFDGTPSENHYKYCPYCGHKIKENEYNQKEDV